MSKDKPEFKKVTTEEKKSHLKAMNYEQVEDEALMARLEAKEEVKEAIAKDVVPTLLANESVIARDYDRDEAVKEELKSMVDEKVRPKPHGHSMHTIQQLRLKDRKKLNKTCSRCGRRMPLAKMDGGKADICDDCK